MSGASEDQWEKTIDNLIKRSIYGGVAGGLAAILLFSKLLITTKQHKFLSFLLHPFVCFSFYLVF